MPKDEKKLDPKDGQPGAQDQGKKKKKKRGGRRRPKDEHGAGGDGNQERKPSDINDINWYTVSKQVLDDSAALPFSYPVGGVLPGVVAKLPGILRIVYEPAITYSDDNFSAINQASMKFYSFIRQANAGAKNYESADLMIYFMGVSSLYSLVAAAKRAYGCLKKFSNYNKYFGAKLLEACGVNDVNGLRANSANYRRRLNIAIANINSVFHIPKGFSYIERAAFLNSVVASDAPGKKFQLYVPFQNSYWKFDPTWSTGGRLIGINPAEQHGIGYEVYLDALDELIGALMGDEDVNIMSGDILKAYGDENCYKLAELEQDYDTPVVYDLGFLAQIHNARSVLVDGTTSDVGDAGIEFACLDAKGTRTMEQHSVIFQKDGMLQCRPELFGPNGIKNVYMNLADSEGYILDIPVENPTPGDVMECTRFVNIVGKLAASNLHAIICGSEVIMRFDIYSDPDDDPIAFRGNYTLGYENPMLSVISALSNFDYHPYLVALDKVSDSDSAGAQFLIGDTTTYTSMSPMFVKNIHDSAAFGMFKIPALTVSRSR